MKFRGRTIGLSALLLTSSLGMASAQVSDDVVKIGVLTDMTGPASTPTGQGSVTAAQMAIDDFGGKVLGKPVQLVVGNHQLKPDIGASIARQWYDVDQRLRSFVEPHTLDAKARGRFAVAVPVADEEALAAIDIEIAGGLREQAGLRLAAVASHTVACDERLRVVWTVIESVDTRALGGKPRRELVVETPDVVFAVKPARNTRLVGHDNHQVSGIVQEPHCFACTRDDIELIDPVDVAVIDVEDAVAIEERGGAGAAHGCASSTSAGSFSAAKGSLLRPLAIHTTPPMAPTAKLRSPNRIDSVSPSLCANPA